MPRVQHFNVDISGRTGPPRNGQRHALQQVLPAAPGVEAGVLVLADDEEEPRFGMHGLQLAHGVERVARPVAMQLAAV
jgi:hypothetical protein